MRAMRFVIAVLCLLTVILPLSGCWNYREANNMAIVSGVAVDKKDDLYQVTTEIIDISGRQEVKKGTKLVTSEGATMFDAVRKTIMTVGKKLYWSHAEILIISSDIAEEGLAPIIDWISRDAEPRLTLNFLISKEDSARVIFEAPATESSILSYELNDMLESQKSLSYAFNTQEYQFLQEIAAEGISATLPTIYLKEDNDKKVAEISGSAVFKEDRLVGFLDGEETKTLLFIKNKLKGGALINEVSIGDTTSKVSLEILKNKTKMKPLYENEKIMFEIQTKTNVALDEITEPFDFTEEASLNKLKEASEASLAQNISNLIKKSQDELDSDIFGFGKSIKINMPDLWKTIQPEWNTLFKTVEVDARSTITIKNSAIMSKPVKLGD